MYALIWLCFLFAVRFLGCAELAIPVLEASERKVSELRLSSGSSNVDSEGRVRLELSWEAVGERSKALERQ